MIFFKDLVLGEGDPLISCDITDSASFSCKLPKKSSTVLERMLSRDCKRHREIGPERHVTVREDDKVQKMTNMAGIGS